MPEPFKNLFNPEMIAQAGGHLHRANPEFDHGAFVALATDRLDDLELKERSNQIRDALSATLPKDFKAACETMLKALRPGAAGEHGNQMDEDGIAGWAVMPMADYVAEHGLGDVAFSLDVLKELTKRSSSEFAVRPFFLHAPDETLRVFKSWTKDENIHVRRLASEGSRPRLPWGMRLQPFVEDPKPILPILEALRGDPEEYVRRSVANNLNDIAKDHPDLVAGIAKKWLKGASKDQVRMVKHALRSLIKDGHKPTLKVLGYGPVEVAASLDLSAASLKMGDRLTLTAEVSSNADNAQPMIVDYVIHHRKANGQTSPKVFKWKIAELKAGQTLKLSKTHHFKPITTRVYYAGVHHVEVQINGEVWARADFTLDV